MGLTRRKILKQLEKFVSIQSVSTDPSRFSQIEKAVLFLKKKFLSLGFKVEIFEKGNCPPLILAIYHLDNGRDQDGKLKTIGIYGHYDVQPEDPVDEWQTPPFKLTVKNGKFFGRGVADNKGHIVQNISAIESLLLEKKLTNNIVFILEGEEEVGSVHFEKYVKKAKKILEKVDVFYLTDVGMHQKNIPQIFYGLRGIVYFELTIQIGDRDLHSGLYGNMIYNPGQVLAEILAKIKDSKTGKILIPGFYDNCRKVSQKEFLILRQTLRSKKEEEKTASVYQLAKFDNIHPGLAAKIYPSFDINGLFSGYQGPGIKTIIPSQATAKFSFRLVEYQDPNKIEKLVRGFIKANIPKGVKYQLKTLGKAAPFYCEIKNPYFQKTAKILEEKFGNKCLFNRSGGSVPAAEILFRLFKKPVILTGFTLPDDNIHAPNENFDEEMFWKGIEVLKIIYC